MTRSSGWQGLFGFRVGFRGGKMNPLHKDLAGCSMGEDPLPIFLVKPIYSQNHSICPVKPLGTIVFRAKRTRYGDKLWKRSWTCGAVNNWVGQHSSRDGDLGIVPNYFFHFGRNPIFNLVYWNIGWILVDVETSRPNFCSMGTGFLSHSYVWSNDLAMPLLGYLWCYHWENLSIALLAFFLGSHRGGFDSCYPGSPDGKNAPSSNPNFFPTILWPHGAICWFRGQVHPSTKTGLSKNKINSIPSQ